MFTTQAEVICGLTTLTSFVKNQILRIAFGPEVSSGVLRNARLVSVNYGVRVIMKSVCAGILCGRHLEFATPC